MNALHTSTFLADSSAVDTKGIRISISAHGEIMVARITGDLVSTSAGDLFDALVAVVTAGHKKIIVDLSDIGIMTRAGMCKLVVAAKLLQVSNGRMRIVVSEADKERQLLGQSFHHLIHIDRSIDTARALLATRLAPHARIACSYAELMSLPVSSVEDWQ